MTVSDQQSTKQDESRPQATPHDFETIVRALTVDQIRFVVARQECASDKEAADKIGVSPATVKGWKYNGVLLDQAVTLMALDGVIMAKELRHKHLAKAMFVKVGGLDSTNEWIQQTVSTQIIEGELGKPTQRTELGGIGGGPLQTQDVTLGATERNRAVVKLAEFIASQLHSDDTRPDDALGTPEHPAVDGAAESGG